MNTQFKAMKPSVLSIVILILIVDTSAAALFMKTPALGGLTRLYNAAVDIVMSCYELQSNGVGIVGDSDGSIVKTLQANYSIPVVLVDTKMKIGNSVTRCNLHRLQTFVIVAASVLRFDALMEELESSIWWNHNANFLILNPTAGTSRQFSTIVEYLFFAFEKFGVSAAQFICLDHTLNVSIFTFNPFTRQAPKPWKFLGQYESITSPISLFRRIYRQGTDNCEALNFAKTHDAGGAVFCFIAISTEDNFSKFKKDKQSIDPKNASLPKERTKTIGKKIQKLGQEKFWWIINTIANRLNASVDITQDLYKPCRGMIINSMTLIGSYTQACDNVLYTSTQTLLLATTQHTGHKTQLEKILTVIDEHSRIGMYIVYAVTFLFFKFFLGQAVIPAVLNLVRLTCATGLTKLPQNVAPTIYLAALFMFVVTLQAIYTGNLASLLTSTISYPHVNTKQDIPKLGYTIYTLRQLGTKLTADPVLEGHVVEIETCIDRVLGDRLAACVLDEQRLLVLANGHDLHVSRDSIKEEYVTYILSPSNPFKRRLELLFSTWFECHLIRHDDSLEKFRYDMVEDDEVKKNTFRRVMNLDDLAFAFVILGIGLTCSSVCFIGEIVIWRIRLKIAKRKARLRRRLAWGIIEDKSSKFSAFKFKLKALHLFPKRR